MKKSNFLLWLPIFCMTALAAQSVEKVAEKPYIDVIGSAEMSVVPDEIYVFIRLQERKQNRTVLQQEAELKNRLTNIGISLENLYVKNFTGDYRQYKVFKKDLLAIKEFSLKLTNVMQLDSVFKQLDLMDVEDAKIERLNHSKMPELRKEVKTKAMISAKEKADYLLAAISEQTGKPIFIIENETSSNYDNSQVRIRGMSSNMSNEMIEMNQSSSESSFFQKILIRFTISARFSIK